MFGLLGEGVLPTPDLVQSITSLQQALSEAADPTAVIARSKSAGNAANGSQWLPDTFIAQVWCNHAMLAGFGDDGEAFQVASLLELLPRDLRPHRTSKGISQPSLVDGTHLMPSISVWNGDRLPSNVGVDDGALNIGRLEHALVRREEGVVSIEKAPWPPMYVLEHVVMDAGLVLVNSVNCGYLDMAVNFLLAAREVVCDAKVCNTKQPTLTFIASYVGSSLLPSKGMACLMMCHTPRWCCPIVA